LDLDGHVFVGFARSSPGQLHVADDFLASKLAELVGSLRVEDLSLSAHLEWFRVNFRDSRSLEDRLNLAVSEFRAAFEFHFELGLEFFVGSLGGKLSLDDGFPWH